MRRSTATASHSATGLLAAANDVAGAFTRTPLWITLGWYDFTLRYRRTSVGPFWEIVVVGVWVVGLGLLFGRLLGHSRENYLAYLAAGVILWSFIASVLTTGANVFVSHSRLILSINNPLYTYVLRNAIEHILKLLLHTLVFLAVLPLVDLPFGLRTLLVVPGLLMLLLTALWVAPLMGFLGAKFRDLTHLLRAGMRFLFFATPVFWYAEGLGDRAFLASFNPFTHFLEIVRAPLIGDPFPQVSWAVVLLINAVGLTLAAVVYGSLMRRLPFWL
jgi:ABC-type polysaccharide/polyol phosphate export permease